MLHFSSAMQIASRNGSAQAISNGTATITTNDPVITAALASLCNACPETRSLSQLLAATARQTSESTKAAEARLSPVLLRLVTAGHVGISSEPLQQSPRDMDRPSLWSVARAQMERDDTEVCTRTHTPLKIEGAAQSIALMMDGTRTLEDLVAEIVQGARAGRINLPGARPDNLEPAVRQALQGLLGNLYRSGPLAVAER